MENIEEKIKNWIELYDEYLSDQLDYPDEAVFEYSTLLAEKKEILNYFGLPNRKPYTTILLELLQSNVFDKKITHNLSRPSINYSKAFSNQIILTLEKLKQLKPYAPKMDALFKELLKEFSNSQFYTVSKDKLPTFGGIYVFYKLGQPIYVGRANNIRQRIQWHTRKSSGSESASFAFNLAKMDFQKDAIKRTRKELMEIDEFLEFFKQHKLNLSNSQVKCIKIENDILQTMFEPYLAFKLGTYPTNNTFENH